MGGSSQEKVVQRSPEEVTALFEGTEDLVGRVLAHLIGTGPRDDTEELMALGREGLLEAAHRFDSDKGSDFRRFAYFRVRGSMLDGMRKMGNWSRRGYERVSLMRSLNEMGSALLQEETEATRYTRQEAADRLAKHMACMVTAMTVGVFADHVRQADGSILAVDREYSPEERVADEQMRALVRAAILELPPPEDDIIRRHYVDGEKMDSIAESYDKTRSWVSRMHTRAIRRMGTRLRAPRP